MNVHHVHQHDDHHFNRCSNPNCDVTIERIRKYSLLRTKEHEVLEKYEKAVQIHDTISKRRQSMDVSHLFVPGQTYNGLDLSPKLRRFSVPNKPRKKSLKARASSPNQLTTLEESAPNQDVDTIRTSSSALKNSLRKLSISPTTLIRKDLISRKLSSSPRLQGHSIYNNERSQSPTFISPNRSPSNRRKTSTSPGISPTTQRKKPATSFTQGGSSPYNERKLSMIQVQQRNYANQMRKISEALIPHDTYMTRQRCSSLISEESKDILRKRSVTPTPQSNKKLSMTRKISRSLTNLRHFHQAETCNLSKTDSDIDLNGNKPDTLNAYGEGKTKKVLDPVVQKRHLDAKQRLENRKNLLTRLDGDIHKVNAMLRKIKCKSMPVLLQNINFKDSGIEISMENFGFDSTEKLNINNFEFTHKKLEGSTTLSLAVTL
ncbi:uncharacterized protein LOC130647759 [Hydractinia symbiolongicarpus]|uniref:uncharacterized protein LOC130647759 n=1 Tax=Hydractinia symbiolongicarpus TaxID=13093 RepID=UPI00254A8E9D|nr:uncharacterized protein LOC130647759 [Hydractinia symbiolongicarpus]XP_057309704.1 uncharacterized protein LOC130647759 [Hydractinia symbiolongicarpus]